MANVFISHRSNDLDKAEALAEDIRFAGHTVWLDKWEISLGDSIVEKMNHGLEKLDYLVLCYSADGIESSWMSREWLSTLARQMEGVNIKILPVILSGGRPPAILSDIKYADLVKDWRKAVTELLSAIK
jgi:hypothetical protein